MLDTGRHEKWTKRFLKVAKEISTWSKDPGTKVGAVIVDRDKRILSTGYNGFPRDMKDSASRLNDREFKLRHTIHAELNAILNAAKAGVPLEGSRIYVWGLPTCPECAKSISQAGIKAVYMCCPVDKPEWAEAYKHSQLVYKESGIQTETVSVGWVENS